MTPGSAPMRILVAVDFENSTGPAVSAAGALARLLGGTVTAVHAHSLEMPAYFTDAQMEDLEAERREARERAALDLQAFAALYTGVPVTAVIEEGTPADAIVRLAPRFDLVVTGTRRLHGPRRWWLGSVAEAIVRRVTTPVLVVPAEPRTSSPFQAGSRIVAVGAGGDPGFERWVERLAVVLKGDVQRAREVAHCAPDRLRNANLVIMALTAGTEGDLRAVSDVLKECSHPVLFIPAAQAALQRSPS